MPLALVIDPFVSEHALARALDGRLGCRRADDGPVPAEDVLALVTATHAVPEAMLDRYPNVRAVLTASVGHDHLDLPTLAARGVIACSCPTYCTPDVADHALALVLALLRGLPSLATSAVEGRWQEPIAAPLRRIAGSTLGVVGLGRIGRALARRAAALEMEVLAHDPLVERSDVATVVPFDELLARSHAISLHVPLSAATRHLIGARELAAMRDGAVLVNTARGGLVDVDALVAGLRRGHPAAAALDVWAKEPPDPDDPRLRTPGLLVTPHAAWFSAGSEDALMAELATNLTAVLDGREPPGRLR